MRWITLILSVCVMNSCSKKYYTDEMQMSSTLLGRSLQFIEVITPQVNAINGIMYMYERKTTQDSFRIIDSFPVVVGRNGMAWDNSFAMKAGFQRVKHEGDGCSPAGIFSLGTVFSYHIMTNLKMPFHQMDESDLCVDHVESVYYNLHIDSDTAVSDYHSFEKMKRDDDLYEYGVWVNYNTSQIVKGNGSCIFLHIWKDENTATSGCTAMSKENILKLINWLDASKQPMLFQHPQLNY